MLLGFVFQVVCHAIETLGNVLGALTCSCSVLIVRNGWRDDDLPYRVELWDDADRHIEEVIALASDYSSACGAYDEAVKRRPGKLINSQAEGAGV